MRHHKSAAPPVTLESVGGAEWWKPPTDARRLALVRSAYEIVVERGLEGLRTRAVSDRAGVSIATLHYYYPSKETLIAGLATYLGSLFVAEHAPPVTPSGREAARPVAARVRRHEILPDRASRHAHGHGRVLVCARRDPSIAGILSQLTSPWRGGLETTVTDGIADGTFRADLDPQSVVDLLQRR